MSGYYLLSVGLVGLLGLVGLVGLLEPEAAPPFAGLFFVSLGMELEGEDGEAVEPVEDELEPDGEVVAPEGDVLRGDALSARSQAATSAVPSATETASARVLNLM